MNDKPEDNDNALPDWRDPFAEPNTMPSGWDLSGLSGQPAEPPARRAEPPSPQLFTPALFAN